MAAKVELQARITELEAAQAQAELLNQISRDLNTASDEDELLQILARPALEAGGFQATLMYIDLNEAREPEWFEIVAIWQRKGTPAYPVGARFYLPEFPFARLFIDNPDEPQLIADVTTDERVDENLRGVMAQMGTRAMTLVPLTQAGRWVGFLSLMWEEPHEFSEQEVAIYRALIGLAAPAVESRRLVNNLEQMVEERTTELGKSQQMLQLVLDAIPIRVFWKDKELGYLGCNQLFADDAGLDSPEEIIGKNDFELASADQAELYRSDDRQVIESGTPKLNFEEPQTLPDGSQMWLRTSKIPLHDAEGNISGVLGTYEDITERKRAEAERERLQQEVIEAQKRSLQELSTPIIPIMERIIVMPLIGSIDTLRARDITRKLLAGIREHRAKVVILDITGVPIVDSGVASHLNKTIQAARLKGARTIVTGISDAVAETIVDLGIDWSGIKTLADLRTGLMVALAKMGRHIEGQATDKSRKR